MKYKYIFLILSLIFIVGCTNNANNPGTNTENNANTENGMPSIGEDYSFKDMVGFKNSLNFKVDYTITSFSNGKENSVDMTYYMKGSDRFRMDTSSNNVLSEIFMVDDEYVVCSMNNNAWNCIRMEKQESETDEAEKNPEKYNPVYTGDRTYAGVRGRCYKMVNVNEKYEVESCYAIEKQKGIPLYTKSTDKTSTDYSIMEATKVYSSGAIDSDFEYPAEPQDMPNLEDMMNQVNQGDDACSVCTRLTGESKETCLANC